MKTHSPGSCTQKQRTRINQQIKGLCLQTWLALAHYWPSHAIYWCNDIQTIYSYLAICLFFSLRAVANTLEEEPCHTDFLPYSDLKSDLLEVYYTFAGNESYQAHFEYSFRNILYHEIIIRRRPQAVIIRVQAP